MEHEFLRKKPELSRRWKNGPEMGGDWERKEKENILIREKQ
jgi:hypothetical protein